MTGTGPPAADIGDIGDTDVGPPPPSTPAAAWLTVQPAGRRLPLPAGTTLLDAARAGGLVLRSSCRNGTCRACIARVESGTVRHRIPWPGLSPDERAEGWVLPCVAVADGDVVLRQPLVDAVHGDAASGDAVRAGTSASRPWPGGTASGSGS